MKKQFRTVILLVIFTLSIQSVHQNTASINEPLQKIAVIIDSSDFYHSSYVDDIIKGLNYINQTYNIDFEVFQLTNYTLIESSPYQVSYNYNGSFTNHSALTQELIQTGFYDLFVLVGYELRRGFPSISDYPGTDFLFYDLSGQSPPFDGALIPENLYIVGFQENEQAFLAGSLAAADLNPLPSKIGIVGTYRGDPRSKLQIAGFQSAIFRETTNVDILVSYINDWIDLESARAIGTDLSNQGYELIFTALQAANTLEILNTFNSGDVITLDMNQSMSVIKNNTKVLIDLFHRFNESQGFFGGETALYGITDDVFYANGWSGEAIVNKTMVDLYSDIVSESLIIPTDIKYASNTSGFQNVLALISLIFIIHVINRVKKQRK